MATDSNFEICRIRRLRSGPIPGDVFLSEARVEYPARNFPRYETIRDWFSDNALGYFDIEWKSYKVYIYFEKAEDTALFALAFY